MSSRKFFTHVVVFAVLALPALALAHGGIDDGDGPVEATGHHVGASALISAWSPRWWALLLTFGAITLGFSYLVYHYIQVGEPKKPEVKKPDIPAT